MMMEGPSVKTTGKVEGGRIPRNRNLISAHSAAPRKSSRIISQGARKNGRMATVTRMVRDGETGLSAEAFD